MDWGVFHVEHRFFHHWQQLKKALKQRNAALRQYYRAQEVQLWDKDFVESAVLIDEWREAYLDAFTPIFNQLIRSWSTLPSLSFEYYRGWPRDRCLHVLLDESISRDQDLKYTFYGPHRADLRITCESHPVKDVLSRGQLKLVMIAMRLAQGILLKQLVDKSCVYLVDDLPSELDKQNLSLVVDALLSLGAQVFLTSVDKAAFGDLEGAMFHVEHGTIT